MNATAPLSEFIDHIVGTHHEYLKRRMPHITALLAEARPANGPVIRELAAAWTPFVEEMNDHLWKEEMILFPMVRGAADASHCGGVQNPIRVMLMEHDAADRALLAFRQITGGYQAPENAGAGLAELYKALEELEADLRIHMHKENDILFPRIMAA
jgi:regulator of cell morphogenesis and NO signaling